MNNTCVVQYPTARVRLNRVGDRGRIAIRTKFFDDAVVTAISGDAVEAYTCRRQTTRQHRPQQGQQREREQREQREREEREEREREPTRQWQVVLLGAGLDTRAWRLAPAPGAPPARVVFELDVPEVLEHKRAAMTATTNMKAKTKTKDDDDDDEEDEEDEAEEEAEASKKPKRRVVAIDSDDDDDVPPVSLGGDALIASPLPSLSRPTFLYDDGGDEGEGAGAGAAGVGGEASGG